MTNQDQKVIGWLMMILSGFWIIACPWLLTGLFWERAVMIVDGDLTGRLSDDPGIVWFGSCVTLGIAGIVMGLFVLYRSKKGTALPAYGKSG